MKPANNNTVYHNNFIDNALQAFDESDNTWDNEILQQGNYWDDYIGLDANDDGIGDNPYNISGGSLDRYPLIEIYTKKPETQKQTPGFEIMISIVAIALFLFYERKNRKKEY
jgi:nitrous oxidase accessory protein NosD